MNQARTTSKHTDIAKRLTEEILLGQYRTGERLPSERDLATRFDANRGAIREAMQQLRQLGLARIEPGGARVAPLEEASLDVISHLLGMGELPDSQLVEQILSVVASLVSLAGETAVTNATEQDLQAVEALVLPLCEPSLEGLEHVQARLQLMQTIMETSGNLPCQLIARTLIIQLVPRMAAIEPFVQTDYARYRTLANQLLDALRQRNADSVRSAFVALAKLSHDTINDALVKATNELPPSSNTQNQA